jgi:23S rRNA (cytosine1962-C5)-methyltransferase
MFESDDYQLLDFGSGRKLERFGPYVIDRPAPAAGYPKPRRAEQWERADARFDRQTAQRGRWTFRRQIAAAWPIQFGPMKLGLKFSDFGQVGLFPEQAANWNWIAEQVGAVAEPLKVLNLFGYTGAATLVAAAAGAKVTHVDASKPSINWARRNQALSGMEDAPIRWLLDDAFKFVSREVRRGRRYNAILLDPPSFGRGPKGEIWKVEQQVVPLLKNIRSILVPSGGMIVLTMYNLEASSLMLKCLMEDHFRGGELEYGELALPCTGSSRTLPLSLFARWRDC